MKGTTLRGVEAMDYSYALMDLTVCGRQEQWEDLPSAGRNSAHTRGLAADRPLNQSGRGDAPIAQWSRLEAGHSDDLGSSPR